MHSCGEWWLYIWRESLLNLRGNERESLSVCRRKMKAGNLHVCWRARMSYIVPTLLNL